MASGAGRSLSEQEAAALEEIAALEKHLVDSEADESILHAAARLDETTHLARARWLHGKVLSRLGDDVAARARFESALRLAAESEDIDTASDALLSLSVVDVEAGKLDDAWLWIERLTGDMHILGPRRFATLLYVRALVLRARNQWEAALEALDWGLVAAALADWTLIADVFRSQRGWLLLQLGRWAEAAADFQCESSSSEERALGAYLQQLDGGIDRLRQAAPDSADIEACVAWAQAVIWFLEIRALDDLESFEMVEACVEHAIQTYCLPAQQAGALLVGRSALRTLRGQHREALADIESAQRVEGISPALLAFAEEKLAVKRVRARALDVVDGVPLSEAEMHTIFDASVVAQLGHLHFYWETRVSLLLREGMLREAVEDARHALDRIDTPTLGAHLTLLLARALGMTDQVSTALELVERLPPAASPEFELDIFYVKGCLLAVLGRWPEARMDFEHAVDVGADCQHPARRLHAQARMRAMRARSQCEDDLTALDGLEALLSDVAFTEDKLARAALLQYIALVRNDAAAAAEAGELFQRAQYYWAAMMAWKSARTCAHEAGQSADARTYGRIALALLDRMVRCAADDPSAVRALLEARPLRAELVADLLSISPAEALAQSVAAKSLAFLLLLRPQEPTAIKESLRRSTMPPWPAAVAAARALHSPPTGLALRDGVEDAPFDLAEAERRYRELTTRDPVAARAASWVDVDLEELVRRIPTGTVLIDYFVADPTNLCIFTIRDGRISGQQVTITPEAIDAYVSLDRCIHLPASRMSTRAQKELLLACLERLHGVLIEPIEEQLRGAKRLIISPGAILTCVPFAALQSPAGRALVLDYDLSFVISPAQLFHETTMGKHRGVNAVLVRGSDSAAGRPALAHADPELSQVEKALHEQGIDVARIGEGSSRSEIERALTSSRIVHFAGHAKMFSTSAMSSCLFTPGAPLTAAEMLALDLSGVDLMVLSGCETGRVAEENLDEIVGLLRAAFVAGARAVVSSTWVVDDEATAWLMTTMYERWLAGNALDHALCEAARSMLQRPNEGWSHPFYWASFVAYGDGLLSVRSAENLLALRVADPVEA